MKRLFLALSFFILSICAVYAQIPDVNYSSNDPEKIYLFDVKITVKQDGKIEVIENITLHVKHEEINRGITRDLPNTRTEKAEPVSLLMDGETHPFFTEMEGSYLAVNFGNDDYISQGKHTYTFTYEYTGAINFFKDYDELYWNVTGNDWVFPIDKARVEVLFPEGISIKKEGISLYTGEKWSKLQNAKQTGDLIFETTAPLDPEEGFTIAIPFGKGVITQPEVPPAPTEESLFLTYLIKYVLWGKDADKVLPLTLNFKSPAVSTALFLFIVYVLYCAITWFKKGRDPFYVSVTQFEPPKNTSAAFAYYMNGGRKMSKILSSIILSLAMKGFIEIKEDNEKGKNIVFLRKKTEYEGLPAEEKKLMQGIPWYYRQDRSQKGTPENIEDVIFEDVARCELNRHEGEELASISREVEYIFSMEVQKYMAPTGIFKFISIVILGILLYRSNYMLDPYTIRPFIVNVFFILFCYLFYVAIIRHYRGRSFLPLPISLFLVCLFGFIMFSGVYSVIDSWESLFCEIIFLIGVVIHCIYSKLIVNVTPEGKEFFEQLKGFEKYMKVAEVHRVEESRPTDAERIFCDYLSYAYALGLYNKWMKKFAGILSKETIQKCIERTCGNEHIIKHSLNKNLQHFVSESNIASDGDGGGSFGGGSSGGGHGGGGGHGR